eukprot:scaffold3121_cov211-Skeletonema_marinoi.AAC.13
MMSSALSLLPSSSLSSLSKESSRLVFRVGVIFCAMNNFVLSGLADDDDVAAIGLTAWNAKLVRDRQPTRAAVNSRDL